ncbi:MAG TPA: MFS transporter [Anaerolineae bacterium]|nr:MFS transporter [Anaerolineae bacterium]HQI83185.1 MFS transporter [Anaerolineae bacterium]
MTQRKRSPQLGPRLGWFVLVLLLIEFLDEFVYGAREAAWPMIRNDLGLTYAQIGMLLGVPGVVSSIVEPFLGILGDAWKRRALILGGGVCFTLALLLTGLSQHFALLLLSFVLFYPASGAFVSLSQATLMDVEPARHEHNMARWTFAGSLGVVAGPLVLSAAVALGTGWRVSPWRALFIGFAALALILLVIAWRFRFDNGRAGSEGASLKATLASAWRALRRGAVLRWLTLLQFSDLMLDVLLGYLALYFVDVIGVTSAQAATAVAVWTGVGLLGDLLLIPLLERVPGLRYLRISAAVELALFVAFLLLPIFWAKLTVLALVGLFNAGWYSILKAQLYSAMPGQSGAAMAVDNVFGLVGALIPWGLGLIAERFDLRVTMWLLLAGPAALLLGLPRISARRR